MGYSTTFRLKGEIDKSFKSYTTKPYSRNELAKYKAILEAKCLDPFKRSESPTYDKAYSEIFWAVRSYINCLVVNWKYDLNKTLNENNNQIDFYGWEYANDSSVIWEDFESIVEYFTEELFLISICSTNGRFDKDNEDYYEKLNSICDNIKDLPDTIESAMNKLFVNFYRDNPDLADESDGYSHFFPEEKKSNILETSTIKTDEIEVKSAQSNNA